jgi:hypothetical protein
MGTKDEEFSNAESKTETLPETHFHPPRARCIVEALAFGVPELPREEDAASRLR